MAVAAMVFAIRYRMGDSSARSETHRKSIGDDMKRDLKNFLGVNALARPLKSARKKWDHTKFHRQLSAVQQTHDLAVVMPGSVHIGALALNYLRENKQVLCISNGLPEWEYEILLGCPFTAVAKLHVLWPIAR